MGNVKGTEYILHHMWRTVIPTMPRLARAKQAMTAANKSPVAPPSQHPRLRPEELTQQLRDFAASIGLSALGIARFDVKYQVVEFHGKNVGDRVMVCVLESNYDATQLIPSPASEQAAFSTYAELMEIDAQIVNFLKGHGYAAVGHGPTGTGVTIHYAVEAGLGQLGLNGQLLTPHAGSRARLFTIDTDAPLIFDKPVDFGINAVCDECKACVARCPVTAIPGTRSWHRGVYKAKLNTERCAPIVAAASGCAICMKVCPVQKYGLPKVIEELDRTGKILGRGTDELEGYDWPLDGRHYGPGRRPLIPLHVKSPPDVKFEAYPQHIDPQFEIDYL